MLNSEKKSILTEHRTCIVCGDVDFGYLFCKDSYEIYACQKCSTAMVWPLPNVKVIHEIYSRNYQYLSSSEYLGGEAVSRAEAADLLRRLPTKKGKMVEVGCAFGFFLDEAAKAGFSVEGLELNAKSAQYCRDVLHRPVTCQSFEDFSPKEKFYDAIVMLDVIEHLRDPKAAITKAHALLNRGGYLLLRTPDFGSHMAKKLGSEWDKIRPPEHLFYFTRDGILSLIRQCGFEIKFVLRTGGSGLCSGGNRGANMALSMTRKVDWAVGYLRIVARLIARLRGRLDNLTICAETGRRHDAKI